MRYIVNKPVFLFFRMLLKMCIRSYFHIVRGFRVLGRERLPQSRQGCILICNHAAFIDTLYVIAALRPRFTVCGARPKYFKTFIGRMLLALLNIIKVESREQFIQDCCKLLESNEVILIYPEMGRFRDGLGEFRTWAAEVALASKKPVIPMYLYGTTRGQTSSKRLAVGERLATVADPQVLTQRFYDAISNLKKGVLESMEAPRG